VQYSGKQIPSAKIHLWSISHNFQVHSDSFLTISVVRTPPLSEAWIKCSIVSHAHLMYICDIIRFFRTFNDSRSFVNQYLRPFTWRVGASRQGKPGLVYRESRFCLLISFEFSFIFIFKDLTMNSILNFFSGILKSMTWSERCWNLLCMRGLETSCLWKTQPSEIENTSDLSPIRVSLSHVVLWFIVNLYVRLLTYRRISKIHPFKSKTGGRKQKKRDRRLFDGDIASHLFSNPWWTFKIFPSKAVLGARYLIDRKDYGRFCAMGFFGAEPAKPRDGAHSSPGCQQIMGHSEERSRDKGGHQDMPVRHSRIFDCMSNALGLFLCYARPGMRTRTFAISK
jgi:hypothetical protein